MYNMYGFVHNIKNSRRNDHFFPAKVSPKSQKTSKIAYLLKICCPKGAGGLCGGVGAELRNPVVGSRPAPSLAGSL